MRFKSLVLHESIKSYSSIHLIPEPAITIKKAQKTLNPLEEIRRRPINDTFWSLLSSERLLTKSYCPDREIQSIRNIYIQASHTVFRRFTPLPDQDERWDTAHGHTHRHTHRHTHTHTDTHTHTHTHRHTQTHTNTSRAEKH